MNILKRESNVDLPCKDSHVLFGKNATRKKIQLNGCFIHIHKYLKLFLRC